MKRFVKWSTYRKVRDRAQRVEVRNTALEGLLIRKTGASSAEHGYIDAASLQAQRPDSGLSFRNIRIPDGTLSLLRSQMFLQREKADESN